MIVQALARIVNCVSKSTWARTLKCLYLLMNSTRISQNDMYHAYESPRHLDLHSLYISACMHIHPRTPCMVYHYVGNFTIGSHMIRCSDEPSERLLTSMCMLCLRSLIGRNQALAHHFHAGACAFS